jgi:hypothetical protein
MNTKQVKKLIRKYFKWWVKWTGLGYWDIVAIFSNETEPRDNGYLSIGHCDCEWKYQTATITFHPKDMRHLTEKQIEEAVVHELMHVFLNEMREGEIHHEERCATALQKAFLWVRGADERQQPEPERTAGEQHADY